MPAHRLHQAAQAALAGGVPRRLPDARQQFEEDLGPLAVTEPGDAFGDVREVPVIQVQILLGLALTTQ
ncbi:hypothetical protein D3C72_2327290 [compost metagenome]